MNIQKPPVWVVFVCYGIDMKTLKCYDCETTFQAETREEILNHLYDHYMKAHTAIITGADESEKKRWMAQFEQDWAAAPVEGD